MSPTPPLTIRAGATARRVLAERGFEADAFSTLVGASGGPKWLVLRHLDEVWIDRLLAPRTSPLSTLGSSIGSFRHACMAQSDPKAALARLYESYVGQVYDEPPTPELVSIESDRILDYFLGERGARELVHNDRVRSHFVASRLLGPGRDEGIGFTLRLAASALANAAGRGWLGRFYERAVFGPAKSEISFADFETRQVALNEENVAPALLASGSIPLVMSGVREIAGAPGTWFDGGITDYHFDFEFNAPEGLILFPHFFDRITPGWFDKPLRWRRPSAAALDRVVMVAPSDAFVRSLPGGKVPDRGDFETLPTEERIARWHDVTERCRALADDFVATVESGTLVERIQPFA
jgi:hypothetical protein